MGYADAAVDVWVGAPIKLEINEGDAILVRKRFVFDVNNIPVEYNVGYYRADSFTYSIEFVNE